MAGQSRRASRWRAIAVLWTIAVVVAACGAQQDTSEPSRSADSSSSPAPSAGEPAPEEIVLGLGADPQSFDSLMEDGNGPVELVVQNHVFDTLVRRDDDMQIVPWIATDWRTIDDVTWEFDIREGVTFHNGEPLDAHAVKFTFDQILSDNENLSSVVKGWFAPLASVEVVDDYTVRFITSDPYPVLLAYLSSVPRLVPPDYYGETGLRDGADSFARNPIGSGPYKFVEWVSDQHITMEANEDYWAGAPELKRLRYRPIAEASTRVAEFLTGGLHLIDQVAAEQVPQVEGSGIARIETAPSVTVNYLMLRTDRIPDVRVRQALFYATDVQGIIESLLGGYAREMKWGSAVTPEEFGYDPSIEPYPYDPDRARELLEDAGYTPGADGILELDGQPLHLVAATTRGVYPRSEEVMQAIAAQWAEVGVDLEVTVREFGDWREDFLSRQIEEDIWFEGTGTRTFDADSRLVAMIHSYVEGGAYGLVSFYNNPEVDELIEEARTTVDPDARGELYLEILTQLHEDVPQLSLYQVEEVYAVNDCIQPWTARPDLIVWLAQSTWDCP